MRKIVQIYNAAKFKIDKFLSNFIIDRSTRRFIDFNQKKWPKNYLVNKDPVVLVGLFWWRPSIYCYSYILNYLAKKTQSVIEYFSFLTLPDKVTEKVYASFGVSKGLTIANASSYSNKARKLAEEIFNKRLKSKWDVLNIKVDRLLIGDLIYDTYLSLYAFPTVNLRDRRLEKIIYNAIIIYYATKDYFSRKKVVAAIIDGHTEYINSGILTRIALIYKTPVFFIKIRPKLLLGQINPELSNGMPIFTKGFPYYRYREIFNKFSPHEKEQKRNIAKKDLLERLAGKIDDKTVEGWSGYRDSLDKQVLGNTNSPKIAVLLHDFCDAVHPYRNMLFPDFYDWIYFLLERAEKTNFQWYVKPHPAMLEEGRGKIVNAAVMEKLKRRFTKVKFIDVSVSNKQMILEGIRSMFTVHGTAGHEFAYMGVPVVNAGDNSRIAYNFNIHPKTIEEYESYIYTADSLKLNIDKSEIEEFFYMHNFYFYEQNAFEVNILDAFPSLSERELKKKLSSSEIYDYLIKSDSKERENKFRIYLEDFFANYK